MKRVLQTWADNDLTMTMDTSTQLNYDMLVHTELDDTPSRI